VERLADVTKEELARYFVHLAGRVERAARALPPDNLWVKPFSFGNSVGHLLMHLTGSLSHHIGARLAGTGYVRDRAAEFTDSAAEPPEVVLKRLQEVVQLVVTTLREQSDVDLTEPVSGQGPVQTRFGLFIASAAHMNNHIGQMAYLIQAQGYSTHERPSW
jgi:uncharacterized damage-inducible protein DinB